MTRLVDESRAPGGRATATHRRWSFWPYRQFDLVNSETGARYLTRWWLLATPAGGICLHRMEGPDLRAEVHDHPFSFVAVVLSGGYVERRLQPRTMGLYERSVRRVNRMRSGDAHTILRLLRTPTWTLLFVGRHWRSWGFWEPHETVAAVVKETDERWVFVLESTGSWTWTEHNAMPSPYDPLPGEEPMP